MTLQTRAPITHTNLQITHRFAEFFTSGVQRGDITLDAPYQRGAAWSTAQQQGLVHSWLLGIPIPALILNDRMSGGWRASNPDYSVATGHLYAVIDGKQRVLAAIAWLSGQLAVPASWFPSSHIAETEETSDGPYVRFTGLTARGQRFAESRASFPCASAQLPTVEEEAKVYLLVNGAGTPQTDADLRNAANVANRGAS